MNGNIHIVGCGGVGSWLTPILCRLVGPSRIILHDGDKLEPKNMDRQLFQEKHLGRNKAEALAELYKCKASPEYFFSGCCEILDSDWIICCADNNAARTAVLSECDRIGCECIIAANERTSAEAYWYQVSYFGTNLDPRVNNPRMTRDHQDDPRAAAIGCTGEAQKQTPQLVTANAMAATLAGWLFVLWAIELKKTVLTNQYRLPFKFIANVSRLETIRIGDVIEETPDDDEEQEPERTDNE